MNAATLPADLTTALVPLFNSLPPAKAMSRLVVAGEAIPQHVQLIEAAIRQPALSNKPFLASGLWLYVDDLDRSHRLSQQDESDPTSNFWHAIMHRREGDFSNSHYWFRRVGQHPVIATIPNYDPHRLIDEVEAAHQNNLSPAPLVELQRREWMALFSWCAAQ